jgi:hypothetical protein
MRLREAASNPGEVLQLDAFVGALTELFGLDSDDSMNGPGDSIPPQAAKKERRESLPAQAPSDPRSASERIEEVR